MSVRDRVFKSFKEALEVEDNVDTSTLKYREYPEWSSIGHMTLIAALEGEFDVMLETEEILEMSSFDKAVEIMAKYDPA